MLTHVEYKVLNALRKIEIMNSKSFNQFCDKYSIDNGFKNSKVAESYVDLAAIYLFYILKKKLNLNESQFQFYLERLNKKDFIDGSYYNINSAGQDALENFRREVTSKRIPIIISIIALVISIAAIFIPLFLNNTLRIQ